MTRLPLSVTLAALLALAGGTARGETIQLGTTGQFQVESKGAPEAGAKVYRSLEPPWRFLVKTAAFPRPVYITIGPTAARLLDPARATSDPADPDVVQVDTGGPVQDPLSVRIDGPRLVAERDGIAVALMPSPPVLGNRTLHQVTEALPEYRRTAARYTPDPKNVETLRKLKQPTEILVFFGSWCGHCEQVVPRLVRVLQEVDSNQLAVTFHGVPQGDEADDMADQMRITGLPTGIVRRDGKEVARITGEDWKAPEASLAKLLAAPPAKP